MYSKIHFGIIMQVFRHYMVFKTTKRKFERKREERKVVSLFLKTWMCKNTVNETFGPKLLLKMSGKNA